MEDNRKDKKSDGETLIAGFAMFLLITAGCWIASEIIYIELFRLLLFVYGWFTFKYFITNADNPN